MKLYDRTLNILQRLFWIYVVWIFALCLIRSAIASIPPWVRVVVALGLVLFVIWWVIGLGRRVHRALRGRDAGRPELPGRAQVVRPRQQKERRTW